MTESVRTQEDEPHTVGPQDNGAMNSRSHVTRLLIENIGRFQKVHLELSPFTLLVGPNDSGKTTILRALRIGCGAEELSIDFIRRDLESPTHRADTALIEVGLSAPSKALRERCHLQAGDSAGFRHQWNVTGTTPEDVKPEKVFSLLERVPSDCHLHHWPDSADEQKRILEECGETPARNKEERRAQWDNLRQAAFEVQDDTVLNWIPCSKTDFLKFALSIQPIDAQHVADPKRLLKELLENQVRSIVYPEDEAGEKSRVRELRQLEEDTSVALNKNLESLTPRLRRYIPQLDAIQVSPEYDFVKGADFSSIILQRDGVDVPITEFGAGSLARIALAILEWSTEASQGGHHFTRTMDEPDYRLHFDAQRRLVHLLRQDANNPTSSLAQCVVSTHSLIMVDATPLHEVVYLPLDIDEGVVLRPLLDCDEAAAGVLMGNITLGLGIPSSWVYLEKAMIIVEGATEFNYVRELYYRVTGRTLVEDGVQVWDNQGCGHLVRTLDRLRVGGRALTFIVLDSDAKTKPIDSGGDMQAALESHYRPTAPDQRLAWVGHKELEDEWESKDLAQLANRHWPRADGAQWEDTHFQTVRGHDKPSDEIIRIIRNGCAGNLPRCEYNVEKPIIGLLMGRLETATHPTGLVSLLKSVSEHCRNGSTAVGGSF